MSHPPKDVSTGYKYQLFVKKHGLLNCFFQVTNSVFLNIYLYMLPYSIQICISMFRKIFEGGAETGEGAERCREKKLDRKV